MTIGLLCACLVSVCMPLAVHAQAPTRGHGAARDSLHAFLRGWLRDGGGGNELLDSLDGERDVRTWYVAAPLPAAGSGRGAFVVYLTGEPWCGVNAGCTLLVVAREGAAYRVAGEIRIAQLPIGVLSTSSHGWPDLGVWAWGGGLRAPRRARIRFDGQRYAGNPSTAPLARERGRAIVTGAMKRRLLSPMGDRTAGW